LTEVIVNALIASGLVLTFLLLSIMLGKKNKHHPDFFLIVYLGFSVVRQIYLYIEAQGLLNESYWMILGKSHYLLNAPIFFFYVYSLTSEQSLSRKWFVIVFIPFIAYFFNFLYHYFWLFDRSSITFHNGLLYLDGQLSQPWAFFVFLFLIIDPVFITLFHVLLKRYKRRIRDSFSSVDKINLNWLKVIFNIWLVSAVVLVPISVLTIGGVIGLPVELMQVLIEVSNVAFLFILGFYGFRQTAIFSNLDLAKSLEVKVPVSYERSGLSKEQASHHHVKLLALMKERKPYLNGELSAGELAEQLNISINHLSQVLSTVQHQNFFDFVNSYRVQEVIEKMKNPRNGHLTLLAMALDSGFNSKTSFNTIFKKVTRTTPSQYFRSVSKENTLKST
ncbi:MAG: helix-turn-helix domain-containing protein, partial [Cyclobacteriaceae bacterium]|nr:helix-turn-helix domain-containing protein [Cyclobacteriaceae bacterium]